MVNIWVERYLETIIGLFFVSLVLGIIFWVLPKSKNDKPKLYTVLYSTGREYKVFCEYHEINECGVSLYQCRDQSDHLCLASVIVGGLK